jgi:hypothetical protein
MLLDCVCCNKDSWSKLAELLFSDPECRRPDTGVGDNIGIVIATGTGNVVLGGFADRSLFPPYPKGDSDLGLGSACELLGESGAVDLPER